MEKIFSVEFSYFHFIVIRRGGWERDRRRLPLHLHPLAFCCMYALLHNSNHFTKFFLFLLIIAVLVLAVCWKVLRKCYLQDKLQPFLFIFLSNKRKEGEYELPRISIQSAFLPHRFCFSWEVIVLQPESET